MKVYVQEQYGLSRAMARVTAALTRYAPADIHIVADRNDADLVVLHVIGFPETEEMIRQLVTCGQKFALIMYCLRTTQRPDTRDWLMLWQMSEVVWSYYDLERELCDDHGIFTQGWSVPFYHAPLGVDDAFRNGTLHKFAMRDIGIMTSGYVAGPEAIEEVAIAADRLRMNVMHLGPMPVGFVKPPSINWFSVHDISDFKLSALYRRAQWVSGLRHVEGFELPALEGLCCGARPIVFNRPEMHRWYGDHAVYVPECAGEELVECLTKILVNHPEPVSDTERAIILEQFRWATIVDGFWERIMNERHV